MCSTEAHSFIHRLDQGWRRRLSSYFLSSVLPLVYEHYPQFRKSFFYGLFIVLNIDLLVRFLYIKVCIHDWEEFMLNLAQDIKPISYIKAHTAEILKQIDKKKNPIVITQNGEAKAVLLDITTYQYLVDSINLMKIISIGESQIASGKTLSNKEVEKKVKELLK